MLYDKSSLPEKNEANLTRIPGTGELQLTLVWEVSNHRFLDPLDQEGYCIILRMRKDESSPILTFRTNDLSSKKFLTWAHEFLKIQGEGKWLDVHVDMETHNWMVSNIRPNLKRNKEFREDILVWMVMSS